MGLGLIFIKMVLFYLLKHKFVPKKYGGNKLKENGAKEKLDYFNFKPGPSSMRSFL